VSAGACDITERSEVREETGFRCRVVNELPKSEYFYRRGDKPVRKTVRWFLMEPVEKEGEPDHEIDEARRAPVEEAIDALSCDSDRKLVEAVGAGLWHST
jgi:8-oxo-dGTP pyrophosphatase MutT (NUDIX family)